MRLKKWPQAWKILLIQEKNSRVDHCDAQWIPACAGMTKKINHHAVMGSRHSRKTLPVIPAKAGIHKGAPVMKHPRSTSWPTNPAERSTYRRDQQPEKAGACGRSIFQWIQTGPSFLQDFTSLCVLITKSTRGSCLACFLFKAHPEQLFLRYFGLFFVPFWFVSLQGNKAYFIKELQI